MLQGQVEIGQGLGLDPLTGVDQQQGALAGSQGAGDFVGEIDVTRRVDQVQANSAGRLWPCRAGKRSGS
jgi:hypothetical protein